VSTGVIRKHPDAKCEECPLYNKPIARTKHPTKLPAKAAIVSRSPGAYEARTGEPFTGESGKVLNHLLNTNGVQRDEVLLTNVVLCAPDAGKVPSEAIKACAPRLAAEIEGYELVVACGREAVNLVIGAGGIDRYRGYRIQQNGRQVVAANNPALVLHDDSTFPNLKRDFNRAFNPLPDPIIPEVEVIEDASECISYIENLSTKGYIAADIESRGNSH
jgi:uracil-DNA glycosylase family 4